MNLFYLDQNPKINAQYHCDKHVVKMILETAQMLSTSHYVNKNKGYHALHKLYKPCFFHHPTTQWVCHTSGNYNYAYKLLKYLLEEYTSRYHKNHRTEALLEPLGVLPTFIEQSDFYDPPQCMPDEYKKSRTSDDFTVRAYRHYYIGEKKRFAKWKYTKVPEWFK
tara:strand:+ start:1577 stop:2071 length:495 start_codon:yes stop_codon:yes gene_type:complete